MKIFNNSWNKTQYVALWNALVVFVATLLPLFGVDVDAKTIGVIQGIGSTLIPALVPNADVPAKPPES